jgi:hypothetical protein
MARASRNTRRHIRQLAREARERSQQPAPSPVDPAAPLTGIPVEEGELAEASTLIDASPSRPITQAETAALPAIPRPIDPNEETEGGEEEPLASDLSPPPHLRFSCPCGAPLVANREIYDKRMPCPDCKETLLVTVLFNPAKREWQIQALRVSPIPEP